ncbi:hypothetical protein ACQKIE_16060 [Luteibacter sp. NPDC031894]|uniref:hypothetical protein n=1 Tax=Luteibacter sp. NPDC031894 TaxID=3390572 RepID=UPI003D02D067
MTSSIETFNRALSRIGIDQFMADPLESSKEGDLYRTWFDVCVERLLTDFPWNFATRITALAELATDLTPGWQKKYAYPVDCLMVRQIVDASGARSAITGYYGAWGYGWDDYCGWVRRQVPFEIMNDRESDTKVSKVIVCDMPEAYCLHVVSVTDLNLFDPLALSALEWLIASEIAAPFHGMPTGINTAQAAGQQYRAALNAAHVRSANESGSDYRPESPALSCR